MSESKSNIPDYRKGKCEYLHYGFECPYFAVFSDSVREGGAWYCRFHKNIANREQSALHVLEFKRLSQLPDCVKDQTELWCPPDWRDELRQQILNANPRWLKRDDETTDDYQRRMLQEIHLLKRRTFE